MKKLYILSLFLILSSAVIVSKVQAACTITVTLSSTSLTVNVGASTGTITATPHNNAGAVTYSWAPCATLNSSTGTSVIATPIGSTTYTVTAYDSSGCTATATVTVNVVDPTIPDISPTTVAGGYVGSNFSNAFAAVVPSNTIQSGNTTNTNYTGQSFASFTNGAGFTFTFNGINYASFGLNTNGYIWFTQNGAAPLAIITDPLSNASANLNGSGTIDGIIAACGSYINADYDASTVTPNIGVLISGVAPNRICTIQWQGYSPADYDGFCNSLSFTNNNRLDFQIKLYENGGANSNLIQMNYWNQGPVCIDGAFSAEVGLRGTSNADFVNRAASGWGNGNMVAAAGGFNSATISTNGGNWIGSNKAFKFTPSCAGSITVITPSGATDLCPGGSVNLTASAGATYQWYLNGTLTGTATQTLSGITTAGTYAAVSSSGGCGIPSYVTSITTNATVTPSISITSNPTPLCGASGTFTALPTNGGCAPTYQWQVNGSAVANVPPNATTYTDNALNPNDQVQVIMTTDALCASQATATSNTITNTLPVVDAIADGAANVCVNSSTVAFTDATAGGTWSVVAGTGTASITAGGVVTGLTAGTVTVGYTVTVGSCSNAAATLLTVNAPSTLPSLTGTDNVCVNSATQLNDVTTGGTWSSGTTAVATVDGTGLVTGVSSGSSVITYIVTDGNGCIDSTTASVMVNGLPTIASITGTASVCSNSTTQLSDVTTGGSWGSGTTSVATVDGTGLVTGVSAGSSLITYTTAADGNGCTNSSTASVTVNDLPTVASITGTDSLCINSTSQLSDVTTGGSWSSGTTSVATVDGTGLVSGVSNGSSIITYTTAADGNGCINSTTASVTVNALPVVASITGVLSVCSNSTTQLNDVTTGGTWSSGTTSDATVDGSGIVTGVAGGSSVITYTTAADGNGCTATATASVTVKQSPNASSSNNTPLCAGGSVTLSSGGGAGYSWTGPAGFTSAQQDTGITNSLSADSGIYTVTVTGANSCTSTSTTLVVVNQLPTASASANAPLCYGGALDLSSGGGTSYSWTGPNAFTSAQQNPIIQIAVSADSGIYTVTVTDANGCTAITTDTVVIYPNVLTPTISQSGDTLKSSFDQDYVSYQWYDSTYLIPAGTDSFLVITHSGNYNLRVSDQYDCQAAVGVTVIYTGIPLMPDGNDHLISLSPNPANDQLIIHASFLHANEAITVTVINVLGQIASPAASPIPSASNLRGDRAIDVSNLPSGIYFLELKSGSGSFTKKFVKE